MTWLRGKRVLVTGATGMIGSWLVPRLLAEGCQVGVLVPELDPQSELVRNGSGMKTSLFIVDLADALAVRRAIFTFEPQFVFHLGAQTIVTHALRDPVRTFETNVKGTWNLLDAVRMFGSAMEALIVASTDKVYGESSVLPYTEDMPLAADAPYDASKAMADVLVRTYAHTYGLRAVTARCGNVYGGGDRNWSRIVPGTIRALLHGERPVLRSDGSYLRDYVYVEDAVDAYIAMSKVATDDSIAGKIYNFAGGLPLSVLDIYREICMATVGEYVEPEIRISAQLEIKSQYLDASLAKSDLGWLPSWGVEAGMRQTVDWYREYFSAAVSA